jgi:hypothetical protein
MSELRTWVRRYLEADEDIIVPVKKLWNEWHDRHGSPSLAEFTRIVLSDDQLEEEHGVDHAAGMAFASAAELEEYVRDMEAEGFYSGPRVKLKSREITREHIARMLKKHNDRMEWALHQAREIMPADVPEQEEGRLIHAIELARQLRRDLRKAGLEPPEEEWAGRPRG